MAHDGPILLRELHNFQSIAALGERISYGARRQFQHGVSGEAAGDSPGRNAVPDLFYSVLSVEIDKVDGKLHEEGVDGFAGNNPHPFSLGQPLSPQEPLGTFWPAAGHLKLVGNLGASGQIPDRHRSCALNCPGRTGALRIFPGSVIHRFGSNLSEILPPQIKLRGSVAAADLSRYPCERSPREHVSLGLTIDRTTDSNTTSLLRSWLVRRSAAATAANSDATDGFQRSLRLLAFNQLLHRNCCRRRRRCGASSLGIWSVHRDW